MSEISNPVLLPRGTRKFEVRGKNSYLLLELEPRIYPLNFNYGHKAKADVAMPWQYFVFTYANYGWAGTNSRLYPTASLFWSKHRIKSLDDKIIPAKVPDIDHYPSYHHYGLLCLGNLTDDNQISLSGQVEDIITKFYGFSGSTNIHQNGFNLPSPYKALKDWGEASVKDPYCYLTWPDFDKDAGPWLRKFFPKPVSEPAAAVAKPAEKVVAAPVAKKIAAKPKLEIVVDNDKPKRVVRPKKADVVFAEAIEKINKFAAVIKEVKPKEGVDYFKEPKPIAGIDFQVVDKSVKLIEGIDFIKESKPRKGIDYQVVSQ